MTIFEYPREISTRGATGLHRNKGLKVKIGRGGSDGYGGGVTTNRWLDGGAWAARAWLQRTEMARMEARGDDTTFGTDEVGCRAERRSRSDGFWAKLR